MRNSNALSFDVEHWYSATLVRDYVTKRETDVVESVGIVLDLLDEHAVSATFFVVGDIARSHPDLVRRIADGGHEVATHGDTHTPLSDLTPEEFRGELVRSSDAIHDAIGRRPRGFRAPNFSVDERTQWAFRILREEGFAYDSSVFPVRTPMYGVSAAPIRPYVPLEDAPFTPDLAARDGLVELPLAVFDPRFPLPIAGGFYARLLPTWVLSRGIANLNRTGIPATIYFHPWEFNPSVACNDVPFLKRFVSFHGIERTREKLDSLLSAFDFDTVERVGSEYVSAERPQVRH